MGFFEFFFHVLYSVNSFPNLSRYTSEIPGTFKLHICIRADHIKNSPYSPTVLPGEPSPNQTTAEGDGLVKGVAGEKAEFVIQAKVIFVVGFFFFFCLCVRLLRVVFFFLCFNNARMQECWREIDRIFSILFFLTLN